MKVIRLKQDETHNSIDRVRVERNGDGRFGWTGSVDAGRAAIFGYSRADFATVEEAEANAVAWANDHGATEIVIVGTDDA